jgi:hypothetical protein
LYALGHVVYGYLVVRLSDRIFKKRTSAWLALTAGLIPDFDLYLSPLGLQHHTWTHSIIFWLPFIVLVYLEPDLVSVYFGIIQHFALDDLVGSVPILLPLSSIRVGLRLGVPSIADTILEISGLVLAAIVAYSNGDISRLLSINPQSLLSAIPLLTMSSMTLIASTEFQVNMVRYGFASIKISIISIGHIALGSFLSASTIQGARGILRLKR